MLPTTDSGRLAELRVEIFRKSGELRAALPSKSARAELARLMREMNCYYSNLIEGLKSTATRAIIRTGLREGLIQSPSEKGVLSIAFPSQVVETYFPKLFTDLPAS